ncbi:MAG: hypothetical protein EZS28_049583, partial [Streblomastix strix]
DKKESESEGELNSRVAINAVSNADSLIVR